ncbi:nucleoside recognition protein [Caloranaerobacter sp. TR13]|nr:nucleoside recognition protein [Caloranaerobacter sp. TR13]
MDLILIFKEAVNGSINSIITIAKVIIPLMILMEILKDIKFLDKLSDLLKPVARFLGVSKNSIFPLLIGLIFGLAYGAGVIIKSAKEGQLKKKDLYLLMIFLVSCHSVFEDTLLFVAIGANGWLLLGFRLITAIILTIAVAKILDRLFKTQENTMKG